jgi:uncharacterized membrane protein
MRAKAAAHINKSDVIKWRSHEPSRIETFSDAAFAFALTLIIVSIEVPKTFDALMETMKGTLSFAACFALLFNIWNNQNIFFRRYGLNDSYTVMLNAVLLFVVLIYAYPLKFLCELLFVGSTYKLNGVETLKMDESQIPSLMLIYGAGFIAIYLLFYLMYRHAQKMTNEIALTPVELYETKTLANINLVCICICLIPMTGDIIMPRYAGPIAYTYFLIPVAYSVWFSYRGKKRRELFPQSA